MPITVLALVLFARDAINPEEMTLMRYRLGASTLAEAKSIRSLQCSEVNKPYAEHACELRPRAQEKLAGVRLLSLSLHFFSGTLHQLIAWFPANHHAEVSAYLKRRFGTPQIETGPGLSGLRWKLPNAILSTSRVLSRASVQFETEHWRAEQARRMQALDSPPIDPNQETAAQLKRRCESAEPESGGGCLETLARIVTTSRDFIKRDDAGPDSKGRDCEGLLYERTELPALVQGTRRALIMVLNPDGSEKMGELPATTMVRRAMLVACILEQAGKHVLFAEE